MALWRVAGYAQPSPIEQILDKEDFTLEELLDEDEVIQECKSLNGRLVAFLREKEVVEKLLRYMLHPPEDSDDPKQQYKYPFAACEVFCCEVDAVFNALLDDEKLLDVLVSPLDTEPPLSAKTAGYFGRVAGLLLLRKPHGMVQYLSNRDTLVDRLLAHLGSSAVADFTKRLAGADDPSAMVFLPMHTQWLVETPLLQGLLERLGPSWPADVAANAADILTAVAHTQPGALSEQLMAPEAVGALIKRALDPAGKAAVPALEVVIALLEPQRGGFGVDAQLANSSGSFGHAGIGADGSSSSGAANGDANSGSGGGGGGGSELTGPRGAALRAVLEHVPQLVAFIAACDPDTTQETPYGVLAPPLGRARLKAVELLAVLARVGGAAADAALVGAQAVGLVLELFARYPFNNLLHHQAYLLLHAALTRGGAPLVEHVLSACKLASWLAALPAQVEPRARPGERAAGALRAGYLGHATRIGNLLADAAAQRQQVSSALAGDAAWQSYAAGPLAKANAADDVATWACGRPASTEMGELGSDEFQQEAELEAMQGMQPALYHRYGVLDDEGDDDDDEDEEELAEDDRGGGDSAQAAAAASTSGSGSGDGDVYGAMLATAMQRMDISGGSGSGGAHDDGEGVLADVVREREAQEPGGHAAVPADGGWSAAAAAAAADDGDAYVMDDDAVVLSTSDDDEAAPSGGAGSIGGSPGPAAAAAAASSPGGDGNTSSSTNNDSSSSSGAAAAAVATAAAAAEDVPATSTAAANDDDSTAEPAGGKGGPTASGFDEHASWEKPAS